MVSMPGFVVNDPSWLRSASTSAPVRARMSSSFNVCPDGGTCRRDADLLEAELEAAVVHHDVEELRDVRLKDERGHSCAADRLRVHDPVGAGSEQLLGVVVSAGAGDDEQVRALARGRSG